MQAIRPSAFGYARSRRRRAAARRLLSAAALLGVAALGALLALTPGPLAPRAGARGPRHLAAARGRGEAPPSPLAAAVRFARGYTAVLFGRAAPTSLQPIAPALRRQLRGSALITPAELDARVSVRDLQVWLVQANAASATGLIDAGSGPALLLSLKLRLTDGGWVLSAASTGASR
jgi:hypothetical protein